MLSYNIKYPLSDDNSNRFFKMNKITKDGLSSNLLLLLMTRKGERYYDPEFGTNLMRFIFEPNINITANDIENEIKRTVSKYMPTLTINEVNFFWNFDDEGNRISDTQLNIKIKFTYNENSYDETGELDISF